MNERARLADGDEAVTAAVVDEVRPRVRQLTPGPAGLGAARLNPILGGSQLNAFAPKRHSDGRMGDVVAIAKPGKRLAVGVEHLCFCRLLDRQSSAAEGDALRTKHGGHPGFGNPEVGADLFSGLTRFVPLHDVGDVLSDQKAF